MNKRVTNSVIEEITAFGRSTALKDGFSKQDFEKASNYAFEIAKRLNLPEKTIEHIKKAYILHDLGKIGIDNSILKKKDPLVDGEFQQIKRHPEISASILKPISSLQETLPMILHHHERWDAKGYPKGLKKEQIPIGARIISVVDTYQALTSNRPYRKAYPKEKAIDIIKNETGTNFDPRVVEAFLEILNEP